MNSVLVTGAGSGIGLAIARVLVESGMRVFAGVHRASGKLGPGIREVVLDVTSAESIAAARREIEGELGGDGLFAIVNNAGVCSRPWRRICPTPPAMPCSASFSSAVPPLDRRQGNDTKSVKELDDSKRGQVRA